MNLHHLQIFKSVADAGGMTAASEQLLISQPAISVQLKALETALGQSLFVRRARGMELTEAGVALQEYATRIFSLADEAESVLRDLQTLNRGSLRIGASPTIGTYFLPPLLVHFQRRFSGIRLHVETAEAELIRRRLCDGDLDLTLGPEPSSNESVIANVFMQEAFIAVAAYGEEIAKRRMVRPADLAERFIARQLPSATGALAVAYFARQGITVRPQLSLGSIEAVKQATRVGLGVTILSRMAVDSELKARQLVALKVSGLPIERPLYLQRRTSPQSKAAIAFGCLLKHAVRGTLPRLSKTLA